MINYSITFSPKIVFIIKANILNTVIAKLSNTFGVKEESSFGKEFISSSSSSSAMLISIYIRLVLSNLSSSTLTQNATIWIASLPILLLPYLYIYIIMVCIIILTLINPIFLSSKAYSMSSWSYITPMTLFIIMWAFITPCLYDAELGQKENCSFSLFQWIKVSSILDGGFK